MSAPAPSGAAAAPRDPTIDLLRGVAILLVVLFHCSELIVFYPHGFGLVRHRDGSSQVGAIDLPRLLLLPFHLGRVGVNLFFVISGLCIHLRFARAQAAAEQRGEAPPRLALGAFFLRRFLRIYPAYWAALALTAFAAPPVYAALFPGTPPTGRGFPAAGNVAAHAVMLHGFFKDYILSIVWSFWSLATEEQFYLLYPLVFVLLGRRVSTPRIVLAALAVSLAWRLAFVLTQPPPLQWRDGPFIVWLFGFCVPRYYEWALGALLAWAVARRRPLPVRPSLAMAAGVALILAGAASLLRARVKWLVEDPCYGTGWFLIAAALLLPRPGGAGGEAPARARAWLAAPLRALGRRSYSVYLVHEMALFVAAGLMRRHHLPPIAVAAPLGLALVAILSAPFYRWIEAPFERRAKQAGTAALT